MKWIKASDSPLKPKRHLERATIRYKGEPDTLICLQEDGVFHWCFWRKGHGSHEKVKGVEWSFIEWLDEQGDAIPADLEQRAKEWGRLRYKHINWINAVVEAYIAGSLSGNGVPNLKINFLDCKEGNPDYPKEQRWLAEIPSLKMIVTGETKEEAFKELLKSIQVKIAYDSGISPEDLSLLTSPSQPGSLEGEDLWSLFEHDLRQSQDINSLKSRYRITRK